MAGGTAGGLVGALFAVRSPPETKYGVARWAILGSVLGLPFGAAFGAAAGLIAAIIVGMEAVEKDPNLVFLPLASGFVGGVFAGVLAAFVSKLSSTQKRKNGRMG